MHSFEQLQTQLQQVMQSHIRVAVGMGYGNAGGTGTFRLTQLINGRNTVRAICLTDCPLGQTQLFQANDGQWYAVSQTPVSLNSIAVSQYRRHRSPTEVGRIPLWQLFVIEKQGNQPEEVPYEPGQPLLNLLLGGLVRYIVLDSGITWFVPFGLFDSRPRLDVPPWETPSFAIGSVLRPLNRYIYDSLGNVVALSPVGFAGLTSVIRYVFNPDLDTRFTNGWTLQIGVAGYMQTIFTGDAPLGTFTAYLSNGTTVSFMLPPIPPGAPIAPGYEPPVIETPPVYFTYDYFLKFQDQPLIRMSRIQATLQPPIIDLDIKLLAFLAINPRTVILQVLTTRSQPSGVQYRLHIIVQRGRITLLNTEQVSTAGLFSNTLPNLQPYLPYLITDLSQPGYGIPIYADLELEPENLTIAPFDGDVIEAKLRRSAPEVYPTGKDWFAATYEAVLGNRSRPHPVNAALSSRDLRAMGLEFDTPITGTPFTLADIRDNEGLGNQTEYEVFLDGAQSRFMLLAVRCLPNI